MGINVQVGSYAYGPCSRLNVFKNMFKVCTQLVDRHSENTGLLPSSLFGLFYHVYFGCLFEVLCQVMIQHRYS